jgi:hypothetical protein
MLLRNIPPPSSGSESKLNKKPAEAGSKLNYSSVTTQKPIIFKGIKQQVPQSQGMSWLSEQLQVNA